MVFIGGRKDNKFYTIIALFIVMIIIITLFWFLSASPLTIAYIDKDVLGSNWYENLEERDSGYQLWGIEKWASYTYKNNDETFPAYISITSFKLLFMMNEDQLKVETINTIKEASNQGINVNETSKISGERSLNNGHSSIYIIFNGSDINGENFKIIGETWNCGISGTSIICIGVAQITNNSETNTTYWEKIVQDQKGLITNIYGYDGLLYNVKCH